MAESAIWVKVFPSTGSGDTGGPGWNVLTATAAGPAVDLSWPAAGGTPTGYEIEVNGVASDVGNVLTHQVTGLTLDVEYTFKVRAYDAAGLRGGWSSEKKVTPSFNAATGGTEATVTNYNGTGETWKTHTFDTSGTLTVTKSGLPFAVLACGGGGGGGGSNNAVHGGAGGGGKATKNTALTIPVGANAVTVGTGGAGGGGNGSGSGGNPSSIGALITAAGGAGSPANAGGAYGAGGGANLTDNISGANVLYGQDAAVYNAGAGAGAIPGGGGSPAAVGTNGGGTGKNGRVVIAYRIG
jgi:hypothetical protein